MFPAAVRRGGVLSARGEWAVVLGASSGTGAAIARGLAHRPGLNVFGVHRGNYPEHAASVAGEVAAAGRRVHMRVATAATADGARQGVEELIEVAGPRSVRLLVHSIACASVGSLTGSDRRVGVEHIHKTFDAMAHSFVYWTQEMLAHEALAPGARLLGLTNWIEDSVMRGTSLIASTKAALGAYVRHLAHELGPRGYRVNLLKFGGVMTPAVSSTFGEEHLARLEKLLGRLSPSGRISTVEEVAHFVSFLAGDEGMDRFNGATIDFTGGEAQGLFDALMHEKRER